MAAADDKTDRNVLYFEAVDSMFIDTATAEEAEGSLSVRTEGEGNGMRFKITGCTWERVYCPSYGFASSHSLPGLEDCALIAITMYNETPDFLRGTLQACVEQIPLFEASDARVATAIIMDGIDKIHPDTLKMLTEMNLLCPEATYVEEGEQTPEAFLFRGTLLDGTSSMDIMLLIKQNNGGKISSHDFLFNGLAYAIRPFSVHILDCGSFPLEGAIFNMWHTMKTMNHVVLVSSNIVARLDQWYNPIQQMQVAEFMGGASLFGLNTLLGVLHPTSGPCCSFRWEAICGQTLKDGSKKSSHLWSDTGAPRYPLDRSDASVALSVETATSTSTDDSNSTEVTIEEHANAITRMSQPTPRTTSISKKQLFRPTHDICPLDVYSFSRDNGLGIFEANVYMVEDTLLGTEMCRVGQVRWMPDVVASFDAPTEMVALLKQRKRWFNGGLAILIWQLSRCWNLFFSPMTGKSLARRITIGMQMIWLSYYWIFFNLLGYGTVVLIHCYIAARVVDGMILENRSTWVLKLARAFPWIHAGIFGGHVSLGIFCRNPANLGPTIAYYIVFGAQFLTQVGISFLWLDATGKALDMYLFNWIGFAAIVIICLNSLAYTAIRWPKELLKVALCMPAFFIVGVPFCTSVPIRGYSNLHDVSWGTKGLDDSPKEISQGKWTVSLWRIVPITIYVVCNVGVVLVFLPSPKGFLASMFLPVATAWTIGTMNCLYLRIWCCLNRPKFPKGEGDHESSPNCLSALRCWCPKLISRKASRE